MIPQQGDYGHRHSTLVALFRPPDGVSWDVMRSEMRAGVAAVVPEWAATGYFLLRAYALAHGVEVGEADDLMTPGHPMRYLQSAVSLQHGAAGHWPPLVIKAFEEFRHGKVLEILPYPEGSASGDSREGSGRQGYSRAAVRRKNLRRSRPVPGRH